MALRLSLSCINLFKPHSVIRAQSFSSYVCHYMYFNPRTPTTILRGVKCKNRVVTRNLSNSSHGKSLKYRNKTMLIYVTAAGILVVGLSYAAVPLYRIFCQTTGRGGQAVAQGAEKVESMQRGGRKIVVRFNSDTASSLQWMFRPQQTEITLVPGETALAFYTATNPTDHPIDGIATYNVVPYEVGKYFMKIQCFCFEEQRLNPHEQVDMPVFFYIDPEFNEDPAMERIEELTLSYTFFESKEGSKFQMPVFR